MAEKDFKKTISLMRQAGYSCIYVVSKEEKVADEEIFLALKDIPHIDKILRFTVCSGVMEMTKPHGKYKAFNKTTDPEELIAGLPAILDKNTDENEESKSKKKSVLILPDFHDYLKDPMARRAFRERIWWCRTSGHGIILIATEYHEIPDLGNDITVIYHGLPNREITETLIDDRIKEYKLDATKEERETYIESLTGLTYGAQDDSLSLAIVDAASNGTKKIDCKILQENKEREIAKKGFLQIVKPNVTFKDVVGHDALKDWVKVRRLGFTKAAVDFGITEPPKGILLAGPPGTGKTLFAKALANEWNLPLLQFKVGAAFSSMLGESEANVRMACEVAERMAPCIFWWDEVNRAFSESSGERDGGTQDRITGEMLTWLSEKTSMVFVLGTANKVKGMPAELLRKGRFDEIFSVGVPDFKERVGVFELYLNGIKHNVNLSEVANKTDRFIPAEIKEIVKGAHFRAFKRFSETGEDSDRMIWMDDVVTEIDQTVPLSISMADQFTSLEEWAEKNARSTVYREKSTESLPIGEVGVGSRRYLNE